MATDIGNQVIFGIQNLWIPCGKKAVLECTPFSSGREKLASCTRMLDAGVVPPIA
jgi:hypothetical protein